MAPFIEGKGTGPQMSEYTNSKEAVYTKLEAEKGRFWDFPIQHAVHRESEILNGMLHVFRTRETTSVEGCPSLKCQRLKLTSCFVEEKHEAEPKLVD